MKDLLAARPKNPVPRAGRRALVLISPLSLAIVAFAPLAHAGEGDRAESARAEEGRERAREVRTEGAAPRRTGRPIGARADQADGRPSIDDERAGRDERAGDDRPPRGTENRRPPVRLGPTTVTVIDENESFDDIITRVRARRRERVRNGRSGRPGPASGRDEGQPDDGTPRQPAGDRVDDAPAPPADGAGGDERRGHRLKKLRKRERRERQLRRRVRRERAQGNASRERVRERLQQLRQSRRQQNKRSGNRAP